MDLSKQLIEDLLKNAREAQKVDSERLELFEKMVTTPGWGAYVTLLNAKIQLFADQLMNPCGGVDECVAQEYVKGAMSGLIMARDIPDAIISAKDQIRSISPEEDEHDDVD